MNALRVSAAIIWLAAAVTVAAFAGGAVGLFTDSDPVGSNTFATAASFGGTPMRLATGTYTGNGVDNRAISGVGFQPDVVFVKCDCTQFALARTSTMSGDATKVLGDVGGLAANHVQTLDADGFTVGNSANVNGSGNAYYWTAFKAGDELKLGTYVGDGADNRSITAVGFQPVWVGTLGDGDDSAFRPASVAGDASYLFTGTGQIADRIQAMEADGFQIGTNQDVNEAGTPYHYIAWDASANVTQTTYTGDGTDNRSITGSSFQPAMVWLKRDSGNQAAWRPESVSGDLALRWNATVALNNSIQALEPDGFQVGTRNLVNASSSPYHYIAFKDGGLSPFSLEQYAISTTASSQFSTGDWSAAQAIGSPDTAGCGELETAWAPATSGSGAEWLEATFEVPVYATGLIVYETFSTGFVTQVDLISTGGSYNTIWTGTDATGCPGQFTLSFTQTSYKVDSVRIYTQKAGFEEIDAVKLIGQSNLAPGSLNEYAISATASSEWWVGSANAMQATGLPDTAICADLETAWAPETSGSSPEWLEVSFNLPVYATGLTVYETFNTGFITQVDLIDIGGSYNTIWTGTDTTACPGQFTLSFAQTSYKADGMRIYTQKAGFEEIDAARLTGMFDGP